MKANLGLWIKIVAGAVCLAVLGFVLTGVGRSDAATVTEAARRPATMVLFTEAKEMKFEESISSDGSIKARNYALVSPRINGIIDDVFVREGDVTQAGVTKLFQIDNEKLQQEVDLNTQALIIARSTLEERKANLDNSAAELLQAEKDFARAENLYNQKVVHLSEYEQYETKLTQKQAMQRLSETQVTLAEQSVDKAEISLKMAVKDLQDSVMYAPIDGFVSGRFSEPGEMGSTGKSIIRIDDVNNLKAAAYLPGQFYPRIATGSSRILLTVLGKQIGTFPITYKAPAIDAGLRTFEIWADVPGDGAYVVPGAQCAIKVTLRETQGVGIPRDSIQFRAGKYWIFVPDGDVAKMLEVTPGLETGGWTELIDSPIQPGDRVVSQGQFMLDNGAPILERSIKE